MYQYRNHIIVITTLCVVAAIYFATQIKFVFDFERFFPQGDPDLEHYYEFRKEFEDDDNFLLIALRDTQSIFNENYIERLDSFTQQVQRLEHVVQAQSLTNFFYFRKFPLGGFSPPYAAIRSDRPERFARDSARIMRDERLFGNLISKDGRSAMVMVKTVSSPDLPQSQQLIREIKNLLQDWPEEQYHMLGRTNFQDALVRQQAKELIFNTVISAFLVLLAFWLLLRKRLAVVIALLSMLAALIIFLGLIGLLGIEMDLLSALFPIVMIIVGVSDVVHLMTKYLHEYEHLGDRKEAIKKAVKEIGLATFLTSFTTAIGFLSLLASPIYPVRSFGLTAAIGVVTAFVVVIFFTSALLAKAPAKQLMRSKKMATWWDRFLENVYLKTKGKKTTIFIGTLVYLLFCGIGIAKITTDIKIFDTLPRNIKVTEDFKFFENAFQGFRPFEIAITLNADQKYDEYDVMEHIDQLEKYMKQTGKIDGIQSITVAYKSLQRALEGDRPEGYRFPPTQKAFEDVKKYMQRIPSNAFNVLVNEDKTKLRIAARVKDVGTDRINDLIDSIYAFHLKQNMDEYFSIRVTGTGVIIDKNNEYLRRSILVGLGIAFCVISLLMALLFRNARLVVISLIPNVFPLLFGGALMGYLAIPLDAPTAIIFAIAFGIAVDDTIHFLSKFKIERMRGNSIEGALRATIKETGKAIMMTSIILFFGFMMLVFSQTISIAFVGVLVAGTLLSAVVADVVLIPPLIRLFLGEDDN